MSEPVDTSAQAVERSLAALEKLRSGTMEGFPQNTCREAAALLRALAKERAELTREHQDAAAHYAARLRELEGVQRDAARWRALMALDSMTVDYYGPPTTALEAATYGGRWCIELEPDEITEVVDAAIDAAMAAKEAG